MVYISLLSAAILIGIDQLIKVWAVSYLSKVGSMQAIPYILNLTYVENYGAAYGIMSGKTGILIILTSAVIIGMLGLLLSRKVENKLAVGSVALIIAGGVGNLIDRVTRGFVVDYLDINQWFSFPVFNFADCCVVIGTGLLVIYVLFIEGKEIKKSGAVAENTIYTEKSDTVDMIETITEEPVDLLEPAQETEAETRQSEQEGE